ncbi:hypothetical protein [Rhodococcus rhodochrous]|uniref:hypothetical protein n=1 Tax=Rhodococcus rhodochrous TaxID=1829 RepID=UPI00030D6DB8|nr:hypothetical protein [Rhodococcus rhodochrous]
MVKVPFYLLEAEGFDCGLVNAREVKNVPGRAKTDRADAIWLAKVVEQGMCRPSLVQPPSDRSAPRPDPLPPSPGAGPHPRAATSREVAQGRPDQDLVGALGSARRFPHGR